MNRLLHNTRLRNKMLLVYFLCIFTPMIVTNAIFYNLISNNVREGRVRDIDLAVEQIKNEFRSQVDDAVGLSSFFTPTSRPMKFWSGILPIRKITSKLMTII